MCVSRAVCVRTGLRCIAATLWPSVRWSERWRRDWRHRSTPFLPHWRAPETLCVCVCTAQIFFSSMFLAMLKDWRAVSAVRMFITRGPELHAGLDISVTLCLKIDAADISNWRRDGVTDGWRDGWVEKRFLMASGTVYALISDCSLTVHIHRFRYMNSAWIVSLF